MSVHTITYSHSDHDCVSVDMASKRTDFKVPKYQGWKFNDQLLSDAACCDDLNTILMTFAQHEVISIYLWDFIKYSIRKCAIKHGKRISHASCMEEREMEAEIRQLQGCLLSAESVQRYAVLKRRLAEAQDRRTEAARIRARVRRFDLCERPTKAYFAMEQTRNQRLFISQLMHHGITVTEDRDISQAFCEFFSGMFGGPQPSHHEQLAEVVERQLGDGAREMLASPFTSEEVLMAINKLNNGSAPGWDGLTARFYKHFRKQLCPILLKLLNSIMEDMRLPPSMRVGTVVLLPKSRDQSECGPPSTKDFRPITLLSTDYKAIANIMAMRLKRVIHDVIPECQVCAVPGRSIRSHLLNIQLATQYAFTQKKPLYIIHADIAKAFDRVNWSTMWEILALVGFPPFWICAVRSLYEGAVCFLKVNGSLSGPINLMRSVRQGCPLSPLLFGIYLTPLYSLVRQQVDLRGFILPSGEELKILAYADDVYLFVSDVASANQVMKILERFKKLCDCEINLKKSYGSCCFPRDIPPGLPPDVQWGLDGFRALGIDFPSPERERAVFNERRNALLSNFRRRARMWALNDLSVYARARVWNSSIIAPLWYYVPFLPLSNVFFRQTHRLAALFIWHPSRAELGARRFLFAPVPEGGLGLTDAKVRVAHLLLKLFHQALYSASSWALSFQVLLRGTDVVIFPGPRRDDRAPLLPVIRTLVHVVDHYIQVFSREAFFGAPKWASKYSLLLELDLRALPSTSHFHAQDREICALLPRVRVSPQARSIQWKLLHQALPTGAWHQHRRFFPDEHATSCPHCGAFETISHLFQACPITKVLWDMIRTELPEAPANAHQQLHPPTDDMRRNILRLCCEMNHTIWRARCERRFKQSGPCFYQMRAQVVTNLMMSEK